MTYRVRTNIQGLKNIKDRVTKVFAEVLKDSQNVKEIGSSIAEEHKRLLRTGVSPANSSRLKPITKETKKKREYLSKYNATHEKYSSGKSNITFTGQLIEAITFKFIQPNTYEIFVEDSRHEPYKGKNGTIKSSATNATIAKGQKEQGRPMLGVTERMRAIVNRLMIRNLRRLLRNNK
jgi:hypothetical protein